MKAPTAAQDAFAPFHRGLRFVELPTDLWPYSASSANRNRDSTISRRELPGLSCNLVGQEGYRRNSSVYPQSPDPGRIVDGTVLAPDLVTGFIDQLQELLGPPARGVRAPSSHIE